MKVAVITMWVMLMMITNAKMNVMQAKSTVSADATLQLQLSQGSILAKREDAGHGRYIYSVKGIPYAKPPVGELRFKDPVPHGGWSGVRSGSNDTPLCPQTSMFASVTGQKELTGDEDCLYLNVYTPLPSPFAELPVMVWFHGGGFSSGGSKQYHPLPLLTKDVVVVVVQYRLGVLGFLSTEDSVIPGNFGLKDATLALRWVQDNIYDLGGDPDRVTIFGESGGGAIVHYQVLSPAAEGLFSRAILQSGNALCTWALREDHKEMALKMAQSLNCSGSNESLHTLNSTKLLACLQKADLRSALFTGEKLALWNDWPRFFVPRVDGEFLPDHPAILIKSGRYNPVDIISGITKDEGAIHATDILSKNNTMKELENNFPIGGRVSVSLEKWDYSTLYSARRAYYYYLGDLKFSPEKSEELAQMMTDRHFRLCHEDMAQFHTAFGEIFGKKLFKYELHHRGERSFVDLRHTSLNKRWVSHADDVQYLFNVFPDIVPPLSNPADLFMSEIMVNLWTNFATSGNPTPDGSLGFRWWPTSKSNQWYLALTVTPTMKDDTQVQNLEFWRSIPTKQNAILHPGRFQRNETCLGAMTTRGRHIHSFISDVDFVCS